MPKFTYKEQETYSADEVKQIAEDAAQHSATATAERLKMGDMVSKDQYDLQVKKAEKMKEVNAELTNSIRAGKVRPIFDKKFNELKGNKDALEDLFKENEEKFLDPTLDDKDIQNLVQDIANQKPYIFNSENIETHKASALGGDKGQEGSSYEELLNSPEVNDGSIKPT